MQKAVPIGEGSMIAILGMNSNEISEMLNSREDIKGICEVANDNAEGQIIISGDKLGIISVQKFLKDKKIKNIPLKVSAPFHCSLMKPAANVMKEKLRK